MSMGLVKYGGIRLILWGSVVAIAWLPTFATATDPLKVGSIFETINNEGSFRDLLFALVPASAVSISSTLDFLCSSRDGDESMSAVFALLANICVLASGLAGFLMIQADTVLNGDQFGTYSDLIWFGLVLTLVTELWVSTANEKRRRLLERNWSELARVKTRLKILEALDGIRGD